MSSHLEQDPAPHPSALASAGIEREIARLITPGLRANAWRPDYEAFHERRLWDEHYHERRIRILRHAIRGLAAKRILDLGCGRGGLAVALRREGYTVVAIDLRQSSCRVTRLRGQRYAIDVPVAQARGEQLPFGSRTFGAVICRDVLEHCENPEHLLREIWRVLRSGGSCYLTVINRYCWTDPHYHLFGVSFVPRRLAERYIAWRGRGKQSTGDRQCLSDMHYYRYAEFVKWSTGLGFQVRDLRAEQLRRHRAGGPIHVLRWLGSEALLPLSLHANHFDFLLYKQRRGEAGRAVSR